jgi:hypothetical protein
MMLAGAVAIASSELALDISRLAYGGSFSTFDVQVTVVNWANNSHSVLLPDDLDCGSAHLPVSHVQANFTVSRLPQPAPTVSLVTRRVVRVSETVVLSGSIQDPCASIGAVGYVASWSSADLSGIGVTGVNSPRLAIPAHTLQTGERRCASQSRDSVRFTVQSPPHSSSRDGSGRRDNRRWLR